MKLKTSALLSLTLCLVMGCAGTVKTTPQRAVPCDEIEKYVKEGFSPYCGDLPEDPEDDRVNTCIPPETHFQTMIPLYDMVKAVCGKD